MRRVVAAGSRLGFWVLGIAWAGGIAWLATGCATGSLPAREVADAPRAPVMQPSDAMSLPRPAASSPPSAPAARADRGTPPVPLRGAGAPDWHIGDQWAFRWESSEGQGDYVWTVERLALVDGVEHYVIRAGQREIYFRKADLATSVEKLADGGELRLSPARLGFSWPLSPGATWRQRYVEERGAGTLPSERRIEWKVEGEEQVRVGAGTFTALRIIARHDPTPNIVYEMWYAPAAKQWVRLKEHFPAGIRYRELTALNLRS